MKISTILVILTSFMLMGVVACGGGGATPTAAVKGFINAVEKNDTEALKKYATDDAIEMVGMFGTKLQTQLKENGKATNFAETINGDKAEVEVTFENGETSNFDLIKVDGSWKITLEGK